MQMNRRKAKLYELQASVLKAAAHPVRLAVLDCLRDGEQCVCKLAEAVGTERTNLSRHLAVMVRSGLLSCRKDGLWVHYRLEAPCALKFLGCVCDVLKEREKRSREILRGL